MVQTMTRTQALLHVTIQKKTELQKDVNYAVQRKRDKKDKVCDTVVSYIRCT
jgi:hypothetical protein